VADAKVGDVLTAEAIRELYKRHPLFKVQDKCALPNPRGQWVCIDCGEAFNNNMQAGSHEKDKRGHRLAWKCECGNFEAAPQKPVVDSTRDR
jgi:hypothetical protein